MVTFVHFFSLPDSYINVAMIVMEQSKIFPNSLLYVTCVALTFYMVFF
jgi:hypothetical protein